MKGILGIRPGKPASDDLRPGYARFNQKHHMIYAGDWNADFPGCSEPEFLANRFRLAQKGGHGFQRADWAFYLASTTHQTVPQFKINVSDFGGTSWSPYPLNQPPVPPETLPPFASDPVNNTRMLKSMALRFGAGDTGVCLLNRDFVYSHYYNAATKTDHPIRFSDEPGYGGIDKPTTMPDQTKVIPAGMRYVLMLAFPMELVGINAAPTLSHMATTSVSYSQIGFVTMALAEFIRGLGYHALPSANDLGPNIPLAVDAGLGEPTRNAKLAHPEYGTCCRLAKVVTDLPLVPDAPIRFGVRAFCTMCKRCAENCPSKAISKGDDMTDRASGSYSSDRVLHWPMEHNRCRAHWVRIGTNCGICIASCPLNRKNTLRHRIKKSLVATVPGLNRMVYNSLLKEGKRLRHMGQHFWDNI